MTLAIVLIGVAAMLAMVAVGMFSKAKKAQDALSYAKEGQRAVEGKIEQVRQELAQTKEELSRKNKMLQEARDQAKKRLRKDAMKQDSDLGVAPVLNDGDDQRMVAAMESQINAMKQDFEQKLKSEREAALTESAQALNKLKSEIDTLQKELERSKGENQRRRSQLAKDLAKEIDLNELPSEVVGELSRLFKKAEQHERLHGLLQGKFQLAQERYLELQRRYFAVCRELAVVANKDDLNTDEAARDFAEGIIEQGEKSAAQAEQKPAVPRQEKRGERKAKPQPKKNENEKQSQADAAPTEDMPKAEAQPKQDTEQSLA